MANPESRPNHRYHLDYGPCPEHFLDSETTPKDLFQFVDEFYKNFRNGNDGAFPYGQFRNEPEFASIAKLDDEKYFLQFYQNHDPRAGMLREYVISKENVYLIDAKEKSLAKLTPGQHTFYITANLRAAGIISLQRRRLLNHLY